MSDALSVTGQWRTIKAVPCAVRHALFYFRSVSLASPNTPSKALASSMRRLHASRASARLLDGNTAMCVSTSRILLRSSSRLNRPLFGVQSPEPARSIRRRESGRECDNALFGCDTPPFFRKVFLCRVAVDGLPMFVIDGSLAFVCADPASWLDIVLLAK